MSEKDLTAVAYKKGNWMRYTLWALAAVCIGVLFMTFFNTLNGEVSASVPDGYRFSVTDNYNEGSKVRTTYYVYDDKIFVEASPIDRIWGIGYDEDHAEYNEHNWGRNYLGRILTNIRRRLKEKKIDYSNWNIYS